MTSICFVDSSFVHRFITDTTLNEVCIVRETILAAIEIFIHRLIPLFYFILARKARKNQEAHECLSLLVFFLLYNQNSLESKELFGRPPTTINSHFLDDSFFFHGLVIKTELGRPLCCIHGFTLSQRRLFVKRRDTQHARDNEYFDPRDSRG